MITGRKISSCHILRDSIIQGDRNHFKKIVENNSILKIERRGKYIIFGLSSNHWMIVHLRMTGKFVLQPHSTRTKKHDRVIFDLDNHQKLIFSDVRCFGKLEVVENPKIHRGLSLLGLDPWSRKLTANTLKFCLDCRKISIKTALLDQKIIAGLGNIYVSEILFDAGIDPTLPANTLSQKKLSTIIRSMRKILSSALKYNGTSISDYRRVDEKQGLFQNFLKVYGKRDQECSTCSSKIERIVQNQRSTFLCPTCQK